MAKLTSCKLGSQCNNAVSDKLSSDKLSLIAGANEIAKVGPVGDEPRKATPSRRRPSSRISSSFETLVGTEISESLMLDSFELTASSALASGLIAYSLSATSANPANVASQCSPI
jgi:hypothetical protein